MPTRDSDFNSFPEHFFNWSKPLTAGANRMSINDTFGRFSRSISNAMGTPYAFVWATVSVLIWAFTGPMFAYSETWQLVINTGTTIVTFLMVFLIQNSQNRDSQALQLKLNEIIFAISTARDDMIDIEKLDQKSLDALRRRYEKVLDKTHETRDSLLGSESRQLG